MKRLGFCVALTLFGCPRNPATPNVTAPATSTGTLRTDDEKTIYALGLSVGTRLEDFSLAPAEIAILERGIRDQLTHATPAVPLAEFGPKISTLVQARQAVRVTAEHQRGEAFATRAAAEPGATKLPSGLVYREERAGDGPQPTAQDRVRVNYRGTLIDGTQFDSSYDRHEPAEFALNGVIPCWTEGVQRMHVGGKAKLVCPAAIAYGDRGQRSIPPGSTLVFEVELMAILPPAPPPAAGMPGGMMGGPGGMMMGGPGGMHVMPGGAPGGMRMMPPGAPGAPGASNPAMHPAGAQPAALPPPAAH